MLINVERRTGRARRILLELATRSVMQPIDRDDGGVTDVKRVVWGPDGRWTYAVIATASLLSGPSLDSSLGTTVVFIGSSDSLFAYEVTGVTQPMPFSSPASNMSVRLIGTDSPRDPGGRIGGGEYEGSLAWIP